MKTTSLEMGNNGLLVFLQKNCSDSIKDADYEQQITNEVLRFFLKDVSITENFPLFP